MMQQNHSGAFVPRRPGLEDGASQLTTASRPMSRSTTGPNRLRSEDSWVEISSQPSSSSLSSIGDEVVTTGLNIQNRQDSKRRRRFQAMLANNAQYSPRPASADSSSQDEYEESSSESDRVMSSSNEDMARQENAPVPQDGQLDGEDDDEDDTSTALGARTSENVFTPQPNAFSHPPTSQTSRASSAPSVQQDSYFPASTSDRLPSNRTITVRDLRRPSVSRSQRSSHSPYNMISPSHIYQPDHDAALRASLSTLLSCAAAARGLPKREPGSRAASRPVGNAIDTGTIRMVPESQLAREDSAPPLPTRRPAMTTASSSSPSPPASIKAPAAAVAKRKAARETSKDRNSKKSRATSSRTTGAIDEQAISPTLMTWVVSAGVVILFSAISFSAGFVFGREVGRLEAGGIGAAELGNQSCARELVSRAGGLKRLRWSGGATSVIA